MSETATVQDFPGQKTSNLSLEFIYVQPAELHDYWSLIRPGLEQVSRKGGNGWMPEDVYSGIKAGTSHLHVFYDEQDYIGFVVTQQTIDFKGPLLFVWALFSSGQNQAYHSAVNAQLKTWAENINTTRIHYLSPRKGWEKVGEALDFHPIATLYERTV